MKEYTRDDFELGQKVQLTNGYEGEDADELFTITPFGYHCSSSPFSIS